MWSLSSSVLSSRHALPITSCPVTVQNRLARLVNAASDRRQLTGFDVGWLEPKNLRGERNAARVALQLLHHHPSASSAPARLSAPLTLPDDSASALRRSADVRSAARYARVSTSAAATTFRALLPVPRKNARSPRARRNARVRRRYAKNAESFRARRFRQNRRKESFRVVRSRNARSAKNSPAPQKSQSTAPRSDTSRPAALRAFGRPRARSASASRRWSTASVPATSERRWTLPASCTFHSSRSRSKNSGGARRSAAEPRRPRRRPIGVVVASSRRRKRSAFERLARGASASRPPSSTTRGRAASSSLPRPRLPQSPHAALPWPKPPPRSASVTPCGTSSWPDQNGNASKRAKCFTT